QLPDFAALEAASTTTTVGPVVMGEVHTAFRPLFGLAAFVLAMALVAFHQMPEKALRGKVNLAEAMSVE
ncbi:MAG: hypothetical protein ABI230_02570, partial [Aestuariivirga sp.]